MLFLSVGLLKITCLFFTKKICNVGLKELALGLSSLLNMLTVRASVWNHARVRKIATGSLTMMPMAVASCLKDVLMSALRIVTLAGQVRGSVEKEEVSKIINYHTTCLLLLLYKPCLQISQRF